MTDNKNLIVVGGGLAGLYAAYSASTHGINVTLYEKDTIGSKHNCGEMFTEIYTTVPEECKFNRIHEFIFDIDGENISYDFGEQSPFVMTDKSAHELIIKKKCLDSGVNIKEGIRYDIETYYTKDTLIDASGLTYRYIGNRGKAICYTVGSNNNNLNVAMFNLIKDNDGNPIGYGWKFPKGKYLSNVGYGVYDSSIGIPNSVQYLENIIYSGGGTLPMPKMNEFCDKGIAKIKIFNSNYITIGNAFGLVNPLLGGGEHLAVISGMLAGELFAKNMNNEYYVALNEIIGDEMRFGISMYEFLRKQDMESLKTFLKSWNNKISFEVINNTVRKAMKKWMTLPEAKESELDEFINQT